MGAWKNFMELEENLSLPELLVLYDESVKREMRQLYMMAKVQGAKVDIDFGTPSHIGETESSQNRLDELRRKVAEAKGQEYNSAQADLGGIPIKVKQI